MWFSFINLPLFILLYFSVAFSFALITEEASNIDSLEQWSFDLWMMSEMGDLTAVKKCSARCVRTLGLRALWTVYSMRCIT
jgi:uncharacterized membrane-anchored protein YitT (DUF2179 family)